MTPEISLENSHASPAENLTGNTARIIILPPEEARRIAAGEVIDRPAALVREFLDNAIDSGALNIEVSIEDGGCKKVEVTDDGGGMSRDDLELCHLPHATSKIRGLNDLDTFRTLGFRGEALASASAVSRMEITTSSGGREAYILKTGPGGNNHFEIEQTRRTKGTTVRSVNLFENVPARKRFLKREGSEAALCRQIFIDKALAFNNINFRYVQDGKIKHYLPAAASKKERFADAILQTNEGRTERNFLHEFFITGDGFSAAVVAGGPEIYRNDRRQIFIFANGRRVQEYSLVQALEYGSQGWFPNGTHPVAAVFVEIDPSLADFNIHPAKREVRFRDPGVIHHAVSGGVKSFFHTLYLSNTNKPEQSTEMEFETEGMESQTETEIRTVYQHTDYSHNNFTPHSSLRISNQPSSSCHSPLNTSGLSFIRGKFNSINPPVNKAACDQMRYAGRVFGLFILIEWGDRLFIIDQHAAHERILYDKFLKEGVPKQELLTPIPFHTECEEEDNFLEEKRGELSRLGIEIKKDIEENINYSSHAFWHIEALPADWQMSDSATVKEILGLRTAGENMAQNWAATLCCHAAIKDGDFPDDETAFNIGRQALSLREPRCPHGRPVWTEISREALYKAVRRE